LREDAAAAVLAAEADAAVLVRAGGGGCCTLLLTNAAVLCALVALPCALGRSALAHLAALRLVRPTPQPQP
jgi:hypothetical protein